MYRRTIAIAFGVLLVGATLAAAPVTAKHGTTETRDYKGGLGPTLWIASCGDQGFFDGINGVWFCGVDNPAPSKVTVTIDDEHGLPVPASVVFWDAQGDVISIEWLCGSGTFGIPDGTVDVLVDMDPISGQFASLPCPGIGTTGTVTAQWSGS